MTRPDIPAIRARLEALERLDEASPPWIVKPLVGKYYETTVGPDDGEEDGPLVVSACMATFDDWGSGGSLRPSIRERERMELSEGDGPPDWLVSDHYEKEGTLIVAELLAHAPADLAALLEYAESATALIEELLRVGEFYTSAIEIDTYREKGDGE